jgi:hypothetical protein
VFYLMRRTLLSTVSSRLERDKLETTVASAAEIGGEVVADYRIICVVRSEAGELQGVGYAANGNAVMYDDVWTVEQARAAIEQGHRLYTLSPGGGYARVELTEEGIRASSDHNGRDTLDELPTCG